MTLEFSDSRKQSKEQVKVTVTDNFWFRYISLQLQYILQYKYTYSLDSCEINSFKKLLFILNNTLSPSSTFTRSGRKLTGILRTLLAL